MPYKVFFVDHETKDRREFIINQKTSRQAAERTVQRVFGTSAKFDPQRLRQRSSLYGGDIWQGVASSKNIPTPRPVEIEIIPMIREKSHSKKFYHSELFTGEIFLGEPKKSSSANKKTNEENPSTSPAKPSAKAKNFIKTEEPEEKVDSSRNVSSSSSKQTKKTKIVSPETVRPVESSSPLEKEVLKGKKSKTIHKVKQIAENGQEQENLVLPKIKMKVELEEHKRSKEEPKKGELSSEYTDAMTAANDIVTKSFGKKAKFIPYITDDRHAKKVVFQGAVIRDYSVLSMNVTIVVTNEDETFDGKLPIQGEPSFLLKNFLLNARAPSWANNKIQKNSTSNSTNVASQQPTETKNPPQNQNGRMSFKNDSLAISSSSHGIKKEIALSETEERLLSYMKSKKTETNAIEKDEPQRTEKGNIKYNVVIRDMDNDLVFSTNTIQEDERSAIDQAVEKHFGRNSYFIQNRNLPLWRGSIYKKDKIIIQNVVIKVEPASAAVATS